MNHFVKNIITKGWLNISAITKGFVLPFFKYEIRKRGGGASDAPKISSGYKEENFRRDLGKYKDDEIESIKVWIEWDKNVQKYDKKIYVELIKKKIEVQLLEKKLYNTIIEVELIEEHTLSSIKVNIF